MKETALNLEVLKSSADSLTPEDARFVIESVRTAISERLLAASAAAGQRTEDFMNSEYKVLYSGYRVQPRFGEYVLPLTRGDAVTLLVRRGLTVERAELEWESMVFPERDYRRGTSAYDTRTCDADPSQ